MARFEGPAPMRDVLEFGGARSLPEVTLPVRFAGLVVSLDAYTLARDSGETIPLTRGEFALLRMFVTRPGRVISRDTLLDAFTNRRFEPFDRSIDVLVGRLRRKIEAHPKKPRLIVTVPGEGYRFDGLCSKPSEIGKLDADSATTRRGLGPPRLSIVVSPFANIGGDPEQDYFADGVTESLTTDLSRISGAFVIARGAAFAYKGKTTDLKQIGRELNVRYVLEGSVQRGAGRMRVNVQLIEAETGAHLWAERFDKSIGDLFEMQDEIVARVANQLRAEFIDAEARRAAQAPNPDSMDLSFQGYAVLNRGLSPDLLAKARGFFARALELDPGNVEALVGAGRVDLNIASFFIADDPRPLWAAAEGSLSKALALAPNHAFARRAMGLLLCETNRADRGIEEFDRALAIDQNGPNAHGLKGLAKIYLGRAEETEAHVDEALRLSPRDPSVWLWLSWAGLAKSFLGEHEVAVGRLRKSIDVNGNSSWVYFFLAASLAHLGRLDEARSELEAGLARNPKFTIPRFRAAASSDNPIYLAQREGAIEGLRLAGAPER
jgi:TolB-like protein